MEIKGIIFDMDGLMVDTERHYNYYLCKAANDLGYPMKREHALMLRSLDGKYAEGVLKEYLGNLYNHKKVLTLYQQYVDAHFRNHSVEVKPGLFELLEYLKKKEYILAVATATDRKIACETLKEVKVDSYFAYICSGTDLENNKPAPDIYLKTAKQMRISTKECVALEDSPNGVRAAYTAGCRTIMVPDLSFPDEEISSMLYAQADSLDCVIPILEGGLQV